MSVTDHFFWDFDGKRAEGLVCAACERDDHVNCGLQTWCTCDCDGPNTIPDYFGEEDMP